MFDSIIGHDRIKKQLQQDIERRHFQQAYLFSGLAHVGKMSLIREIVSEVRGAASKQASGGPFNPDSPLGRQILAGEGPGIKAFYDDGESLKIEQIRTIQDFASRRTAEDEISFVVVEHAERLTIAAGNAFLKILEEPTPRLAFLLTTGEEKKLLPTIRSRVQVYRFTTIPEREVSLFLRGKIHNEILVQELMKLSSGRIGLAMTLLHDEKRLDRLRRLYDFAMLLPGKDLVDRFFLAEHLTGEDYTESDLFQFLVYLSLKLRDEGLDQHRDSLSKLQRLRRVFHDTQVNKRLWLENLFLNM
jgi:DNA polymerase-3 subunit delta'